MLRVYVVICAVNAYSSAAQNHDAGDEENHYRRLQPNNDNIQAVNDIVEGDCCIAVGEIATELGLSIGSVHTMLSDTLGCRKKTMRWVLRLLTEYREISGKIFVSSF